MHHSEPWPYGLPTFARAHRAASPNGEVLAEIVEAHEVSMSSPTSGSLRLSVGLVLRDCNPNFIWSTDSRYLAVPQFFARFGVFRRQRILVIDVAEHRVYGSQATAHYFAIDSFDGNVLNVTREPLRAGSQERWTIPADLGAHWVRLSAWSPPTE